MHDIERVRPHIAFRPARVLARPRATCVTRLHKARVVVEDRERRGERACAEARCVVILAERRGEDREGVVVIWKISCQENEFTEDQRASHTCIIECAGGGFGVNV